MILHLITSKIFVGYAVDQFEAVHRNNNSYYFIGSSMTDKESLPPDTNIRFILRNSKEYNALVKNLGAYDALILHSLHPSMFHFVLDAPPGLPIAWIFFGQELYNTFRRFRLKVLLPETRKYVRLTTDFYLELIKPLYRKLIGRKTNESYVRDCLKRINFFATPQEKTYQFLYDQGMTKARYVDFSYYSIEESVGKELLEKKVSGNDILVGNSASLTNNYFDTFDLLSRNGIDNKNIVVPLSYGDFRVGKRVKKAGYKKFGDSFHPISDFLPRAEYNQLMLGCSFVIMNHLRPQARGNIVTALWLGAKVFMNKENLFYHELVEKGLIVFPVSDIEDKRGEAFQMITIEELEKNRKILSELYSYDKVLNRTRKLVDFLKE